MISQQSFGYNTTYPDRLTSFGGTSISYNSTGCPTTVNGYTATWTRGKLSKLTSGSRLTGTQTYDYMYNAFGQRIGTNYTYVAGTSSSSAVVIGMLTGYNLTFCYDQSGRLICESKISQYYGEGSGTEKKVYLYDESGIIGMVYTSESGTTTTYYFQRNLLGDVIGIYDTSGEKVGGYAYDAWGNCTITLNTNGIATRNPIRYRGYYYDQDTKLYYLNARYYCPEWRRFISPDDTGYLDPEMPNGLNLYAYCNNDPVNYADPTGYSAIVVGLIIGAFVGAGIGFGTVAYTDYQDDGQIFNGSVTWYEYLGGTVTGSVLGAGVGGVIGAGGAVLTSAISSVANKLISDLFAYTLTGTSFGTWEDYAVAFISGGLIKGLDIKGIVKTAYDVVGRPFINQVVKIGTNRQDTINIEKYAYDVVTRGLTTFAPSPWKAFYRGGFRSLWDLKKRGYFA